MLPSLPGSNPALSAQFLTSDVLACHREPLISARGPRARVTRMASATSSAARRVRFTATTRLIRPPQPAGLTLTLC